MSDIELLPCAHCGAQPYVADPTNFPGDWEHPWEHKGCFLDGFHITNIAAWNRRASDPLAAELVGVLQAITDHSTERTVAMNFKDLIGPHKLETAARTDVRHPFTDGDGIAWAMDDKVYMIFEDVNDGYRSSASPILVADGPAYSFWSPDYINRDVVGRHVTQGEYSGEADILELVDVQTGHVWLRVGTDNVDDYYPSFVAVWTPMPPDTSNPA